MIQPFDIHHEIRQEAHALGFDEVRFCDADGAPGLERYQEMLDEHRHAGMSWMARGLPPRRDPKLVLPGLRSAIVMRTDYGWQVPPDPGGLTGKVSAYAWGRDYHNLVGKRLRKFVRSLRGRGVQAYGGVDSRPIIERAWASRAGLGFSAKNCCTIKPGQGSFFFLSVVFVDLVLPADPALKAGLEQFCGSCTRCIDACPTDAFVAPGKLDSRRCISYLNIEHRGDIPEPLRAPMGRWVFGCDACQDVCPHNHAPPSETHADLSPRAGHAWLDLEWILNTSDEQVDLHFLGSPIRRSKPEGLKRNACIVLGNIGDSAARPSLFRALSHSSETVREAATWALERV